MSSSYITHIRRDLQPDSLCSHFLFLLLRSAHSDLHFFTPPKRKKNKNAHFQTQESYLMCSLRPEPSMVFAPHLCSCSDTSFWNAKSQRVDWGVFATNTHTHTHLFPPQRVYSTSKSGSVSQSSPSAATFMLTLWPTTDFHIWGGGGIKHHEPHWRQRITLIKDQIMCSHI